MEEDNVGQEAPDRGGHLDAGLRQQAVFAGWQVCIPCLSTILVVVVAAGGGPFREHSKPVLSAAHASS